MLGGGTGREGGRGTESTLGFKKSYLIIASLAEELFDLAGWASGLTGWPSGLAGWSSGLVIWPSGLASLPSDLAS